jgi:hypothetical protein
MGADSVTEYRPGGQVITIKEDDRTPEEKQTPLLAGLANRRWQATQRFTYDGVETVADGATTALTGAIVAMQLPGGPDTVLWKLADGDFREWDLAALVAFGQAVRAHIQACFDHEATLAAQILNGEEPNIEAGWPEGG